MRDARILDITTLRVVAAEMSQRGLTPHDIGAALHIDPAAVRRLLVANESEAATAHAAAWAAQRQFHSDSEVPHD